jgi:BirA family biotin operon repressor/biotin-[acetyl-CoA-carboxylase] ligase
MSLVLRPDCPPGRAAQLGFVTALAVGEALAALLPLFGGISYKWPNDVLANNRKIAGILLESEVAAPEKLSFLIVGVGVNLIASPEGTDYPATSIVEEGCGMVSPAELLEEFSRRFQSWEKRWRQDGFPPVRAAWRSAAASRGAPIRVRLDAATLDGRFVDLDEWGALVLECAGEHRRISAGEVFPATAPGLIR